jgi:hypothetical protein
VCRIGRYLLEVRLDIGLLGCHPAIDLSLHSLPPLCEDALDGIEFRTVGWQQDAFDGKFLQLLAALRAPSLLMAPTSNSVNIGLR